MSSKRKRTRVVAAVVFLLIAASLLTGRRHDRRDKLPRAAILPPGRCPLSRILRSKSDAAYICCFGLDVSSFDTILSVFEIEFVRWKYDRNSGQVILRSSPCGKALSITPCANLALTLAWLRTQGEQRSLSCFAGTTPSVTSRQIHVGVHVLSLKLSRLHSASINFPADKPQLEAFASIIAARYPRHQSAIGFIDGLKLKVHPPADPYWENAM